MEKAPRPSQRPHRHSRSVRPSAISLPERPVPRRPWLLATCAIGWLAWLAILLVLAIRSGG